MKLTIIIPCYNGAKTLAEQLEALAAQEWDQPWEIVFADNGSTDRSRAIAESYRERLPNLRIVDASERRGQPFALNTGAAAARGESLAFCDADDVVGDGWVAAMGEALLKYDFVASRFDLDRLNSPTIRRVRRNRQTEGLQPYLNPPYLSHAGGCGLGVKRALHEAIGGFDETLPYLHDTDYCWRLQLKGTELHFVPDAVMHVRFREDFRATYRQSRNYAEYNVLLYRRYRALGMPPIQWRRAWAGWFKLMRTLPGLRTEFGRLVWGRNLGWRIGRLKGSFKHRVLAP